MNTLLLPSASPSLHSTVFINCHSLVARHSKHPRPSRDHRPELSPAPNSTCTQTPRHRMISCATHNSLDCSAPSSRSSVECVLQLCKTAKTVPSTKQRSLICTLCTTALNEITFSELDSLLIKIGVASCASTQNSNPCAVTNCLSDKPGGFDGCARFLIEPLIVKERWRC
ncbi:hypothetical protein BLNAU_4766 [Blattamonas nauphoetae]|uniref:Saposin B-type domain-containing protein n=1 Tax=Blattamonas nauphoetae TaxID=2049346 RepID=A0ABQ9Y8Y6_9EUKA|nr:hypothetical protein BLNAU_4766 [Blattamonas nauphoetae]